MFLGAGDLQLSCVVALHCCYGCLSDILLHCAGESEVAIGARELLRQLRLALYYRAFYNITSELAGSGVVGVPVGEAGKAGVCAVTALQASRVAVWAARAGVEPVAVGVERRFDEFVVDRHLPASPNSAAGIPRCALHCNELHIARIVAVLKERMAILVEEVGSGLGIVRIIINRAAWVVPMKMAA